jgi:hypothetical protein
MNNQLLMQLADALKKTHADLAQEMPKPILDRAQGIFTSICEANAVNAYHADSAAALALAAIEYADAALRSWVGTQAAARQ